MRSVAPACRSAASNTGREDSQTLAAVRHPSMRLIALPDAYHELCDYPAEELLVLQNSAVPP